MRSNRHLRALIPNNIFPLVVSFWVAPEARDDYGGRGNDQSTWTQLYGDETIHCLFTHGVRGSVRDFGLRKDDREFVWVKASITTQGVFDVPYGAIALITWPAEEGPLNQRFTPAAKAEHWRIIGIEHRPLSGVTRFPIEKMDGAIRS